MQIIIEGISVDLELPGKDVKVKQVVEEVEAYLLSEGKVPVALSIDGRSLTQEQFEAMQENILTGAEVLDFGVVRLEQFMLNQLQGVAVAHDALLQQIRIFADNLVYNTVNNAEIVMNELKHFFEFWTNLYQLFPRECESLVFNGQNFEGWLNGLAPKFQEVVAAMESSDFPKASDLIKSDIIPLLELTKPVIAAMEEKFMTSLSAK
ncbi:MAG: hypothetical protein K0S74_727 [Chlamydiales bacterium]|jgi:hypothetical protein|nr:hypothetical protein [Chlamydiales bacterium]